MFPTRIFIYNISLNLKIAFVYLSYFNISVENDHKKWPKRTVFSVHFSKNKVLFHILIERSTWPSFQYIIYASMPVRVRVSLRRGIYLLVRETIWHTGMEYIDWVSWHQPVSIARHFLSANLPQTASAVVCILSVSYYIY